MEPLQEPPGPEEGRLRDKPLAVFLKRLASRPGRSLCVATSRLRLTDLDSFENKTARAVDLEALSEAAGAHLLESLGARGSDGVRRAASREFGGHALALTLLGRFLVEACDGDLRRRSEVGPLTDEPTEGGHAKRVLASYEKWLDERDRALLRLVGLFDRPAPKPAIDVLRAPPAIVGLTEPLMGISDRDFKLTVSKLRRARLLEDADERDPDTLDAHPLIREYFGSSANREGNNRLFEYYKGVAKEDPKTLDDLAPLYAAVVHGCRAGRYSETLDDVYWSRILKQENFSQSILGAYGSDLMVLAAFFKEPWTRVVSELDKSNRAFVIGQAGFCLQALGRLRKAGEMFREGAALRVSLQDWRNAAIQAANLTDVLIVQGELQSALRYAEESLRHAETSGDDFQRMNCLSGVANVHHQMARFTEAEAIFHEAEEIQIKRGPNSPILYSLRGYQFCDLLLGKGETVEVHRRASQTLQGATATGWLLDQALDHLSLGRAAMAGGDLIKARQQLDEAVYGFRRAGNQGREPLGFLARAEYFVRVGDLSRARADLDEAYEIATRGGMRLHECDAHLGYARLAVAEKDYKIAKEHLAKARGLVDETGYRRRERELEELGRLIKE